MKNIHRFTGVIVGLAMMVAVAGFSISTAEITGAVAADRSDTAAEEEVLTKATNQTEESDVVVEETTTIEEVTTEEEVPVEEPVEEAEPEYIEYTVQAGDSLWSIAQEYYGSGNKYVALAAYNEMATSDYIHPGDVLKVQNTDDVDLEAITVEYSAAPEAETKTSEPVATTVTSPVLGASSFDGDMDYDQAVALLKDGSSVDTSNMEYMGNWRITGYDPHCAHCCGKTNGITASGNQAEFGTSAGCNNLPLGTIIYIEGYGTYRIDDRGGMSTNHIDIAAPSHDVCYQLTGHANVYVVSYPS